jgi:hypothetical protein
MSQESMGVFDLLKTKLKNILSDKSNKKTDALTSNAIIIRIIIVGLILYLSIYILIQTHH